MNKILKYGLPALLVTISVMSCNNNNSKSVTDTENVKEITEQWTWPDSIESVLVVPDSILSKMMADSTYTILDYWTPEQKQLAELIINTLIDDVKPVNEDSLSFALSREEFMKRGIPEAYYDQILHDVRNLNSLKENGFDFGDRKLAEWWEEDKEDFRKALFKDHK